jgi:hypothetical protein
LGVRALDDILSHGRDREPRPWPGRLAMIAALIVVLAGGALYLGVPRHSRAPEATHQAPATRGPAQGPASSAALSLPLGPDGITGQTLAWDRNLRLPVAGQQPVWFSPASGRFEPIAGLPADGSGYQFIRIVGGWAVLAGPAWWTECGSCAPPSAPVWLLADGARSATRIGTANLVAPAATAGAAWLTSYAPGAIMTTAAGTAQEAGATGALTRPVRLPPGYAIDRGTDRGLLLAPVGQQPGGAYQLWDPSARRARQSFDQVLAASPGKIAWTSRCAPRCAVQVLDLVTGRHTVVALPAGSSAASGALSPDGGFLALQVSFSGTGDAGELATQLEVAPTSSGRLAVVPGTWASSDALVGFGWPAGGDSLVAEFSFMPPTQLASWHPGASRPAVTVFRPAPNQYLLVVG